MRPDLGARDMSSGPGPVPSYSMCMNSVLCSAVSQFSQILSQENSICLLVSKGHYRIQNKLMAVKHIGSL